MKAARSAGSWEEMIDLIKSKRYPRTRIQRLLLCAYLGLDQHSLDLPISYVRLLAASQTGRQMLRQLKKSSQLSIVNPGEPPKDAAYYRLETQTSDLFALFSSTDHIPCKLEQNARLQIN